MTTIFSTLRKSTVSADLSDAEVALLATLFEVSDYSSGDFISQPNEGEADSLYLLLAGHLEITVHSIEGDLDIHLIKPGDLANIISFVGGGGYTRTTLSALETSRVMCLSRTRFEGLAWSHPALVYAFHRGILRYVHSVMRHFNSEFNSLSHRVSGAAC